MSGRNTQIRTIAGLAAAGLAALFVTSLILLGGDSESNSARAGASAPVLRIGAVFSLTGSGDVYGPQQARAAALAVSQINATGGVGGAKLKLVLVNDRSSPALGRRLIRRLVVDDRVVGILGPSLSLVATRADAIASALHTPVLAVSNTANGIVGRCAYDCSWVWRDSLGEATAVPAAIRWLTERRHIASAAIINVAGDVLGVDDAQIAARAFARDGVRITNRVQVTATGPIRARVESALRGDPDVLMIGATSGRRAAQILTLARKDRFRGVVIGGNAFNSAATAALAGKAGAGAISGSAWYAGNNFPANSAFISSYRNAFGREPDQFAAQAYTGVEILADAMRLGGLGSTSQPVAAQRSVLQGSLPRVALLTPLGELHFTSDHDVSQTVWILRETRSATHTLAGFCTPGC